MVRFFHRSTTRLSDLSCVRGEPSRSWLSLTLLLASVAWIWLAAPASALEPAQRLQRQGAEECVLAPDFQAPGTSGRVYTSVEYHDGQRSVLVVAGEFEVVESVRALNIASWDGQRWSPLGPGLNGQVRSLAVYDDGTGPALYAGGYFTLAGRQRVDHIARWDGTSWSPLGTGQPDAIWALAVHDDGDGPALYAGGYSVDQVAVAKWDGRAWTPLPAGPDGLVLQLTSYRPADGAPILVAGGTFEPIGDSANEIDGILAWDGAAWRNLGEGIEGLGRALAVYDDGSGAALYVAGLFERNGFSSSVANIARWDGQAWHGLPDPFSTRSIEVLTVFDDGEGAQLYGASYSGPAGSSVISRWDGVAWSSVLEADGVTSYTFETLTGFEDDNGRALFAGGWFPNLQDHVAFGLARWDGDDWSPLRNRSAPSGHGLDSSVLAWAVHDDGTGSALYAAGFFTRSADGTQLDHIAKWTGEAWTPLGTGMDGAVRAMVSFDAGDGPRLVAAGDFFRVGEQVVNSIASWNGENWQPLGAGFDSSVTSLAVLDVGAGPQLYAAGWFGGVARWNGQVWETVGADSLHPGIDGLVVDMVVSDEIGGPALYVVGLFEYADGKWVEGLARWDGTNWSAPADPFSIFWQAVAVFDDGTGPAIFVAGSTDIRRPNGIYRWDGVTWEVAGSPPRSVQELRVLDDGSRPALYAAGSGTLGSVFFGKSRTVRWNGDDWEVVGPTSNGAVLSLTIFDDGSGPALFAGGYFTAVGDRSSAHAAKLTCGD